MGNLQNKKLIDRFHATNLEGSYSGNGLSQGNNITASTTWIDAPPRFWSGWDYMRTIKLKCNMLPPVVVPYNPPTQQQQKCRGGCLKIESLSHVLQQCPVTHWKRINRHDRICVIIKKAAETKHLVVETEPNIRNTDQILKKRNLILQKDKKLYICDFGVHWEGPNSLEAAYSNKIAIYSTPPFLEAVNKIYNPPSISVLAFIISARGLVQAK